MTLVLTVCIAAHVLYTAAVQSVNEFMCVSVVQTAANDALGSIFRL